MNDSAEYVPEAYAAPATGYDDGDPTRFKGQLPYPQVPQDLQCAEGNMKRRWLCPLVK
ncbi:hypothetical protein CGRA01v4_13238 [Colletotrichum graminicola]|nr:hypothetical protein CGRA01v4_13238 [Colletotrichum graminicola]